MSRIAFPALYESRKPFHITGIWQFEWFPDRNITVDKEIVTENSEMLLFTFSSDFNDILTIQVSTENSNPFSIRVEMSLINPHNFESQTSSKIIRFSPLFPVHNLKFPLLQSEIAPMYISDTNIVEFRYKIDNFQIETDWTQEYQKLCKPLKKLANENLAKEIGHSTNSITPIEPRNSTTTMMKYNQFRPLMNTTSQEHANVIRRQFFGTSDSSLLSAFVILCYKVADINDAIKSIPNQDQSLFLRSLKSYFKVLDGSIADISDLKQLISSVGKSPKKVPDLIDLLASNSITQNLFSFFNNSSSDKIQNYMKLEIGGPQVNLLANIVVRYAEKEHPLDFNNLLWITVNQKGQSSTHNLRFESYINIKTYGGLHSHSCDSVKKFNLIGIIAKKRYENTSYICYVKIDGTETFDRIEGKETKPGISNQKIIQDLSDSLSSENPVLFLFKENQTVMNSPRIPTLKPVSKSSPSRKNQEKPIEIIESDSDEEIKKFRRFSDDEIIHVPTKSKPQSFFVSPSDDSTDDFIETTQKNYKKQSKFELSDSNDNEPITFSDSSQDITVKICCTNTCFKQMEERQAFQFITQEMNIKQNVSFSEILEQAKIKLKTNDKRLMPFAVKEKKISRITNAKEFFSSNPILFSDQLSRNQMMVIVFQFFTNTIKPLKLLETRTVNRSMNNIDFLIKYETENDNLSPKFFCITSLKSYPKDITNNDCLIGDFIEDDEQFLFIFIQTKLNEKKKHTSSKKINSSKTYSFLEYFVKQKIQNKLKYNFIEWFKNNSSKSFNLHFIEDDDTETIHIEYGYPISLKFDRFQDSIRDLLHEEDTNFILFKPFYDQKLYGNSNLEDFVGSEKDIYITHLERNKSKSLILYKDITKNDSTTKACLLGPSELKVGFLLDRLGYTKNDISVIQSLGNGQYHIMNRILQRNDRIDSKHLYYFQKTSAALT